MPSYRQPGFASGELSPGMWGRSDQSVYETGLRYCRNFLITPAGAASFRPGMELLKVYRNRAMRLAPYTFKEQIVGVDSDLHRGLLVVRPGEFEIWNFARGTNSSGPYPHPYTAADLPKMRFMQMGLYTLITCPGHPIREVAGYGPSFVVREFKTEVYDHASVMTYCKKVPGSPKLTFTITCELFDAAANANREQDYTFEVTQGGLRIYHPDGALLLGPYDVAGGRGGNYYFPLEVRKSFLSGVNEVRYDPTGSTDGNLIIDITSSDSEKRQLGMTQLEGTDGEKYVTFYYSVVDPDNPRPRLPNSADFDLEPASSVFSKANGYFFTRVIQEGGFTRETSAARVQGAPARVYASREDPGMLMVDISTISADTVAFNIYKGQDGALGYIGTIENPKYGSVFYDYGTEPLWDQPPPPKGDPLPAGKEIPTVAAIHQERMVLAGSSAEPSRLWFSKVDSFQDFAVHEPLTRVDEPLYLDLGTSEFENITDMVSLQDLLVFTDRAVWAVTGPEGGQIVAVGANRASRNNFDGHRGPSRAVPVRSGVMYQTRGGVLYLRYEWEIRSYITNDVSAHASHLFEPSTAGVARSLAFAKNPGPILWAVREDGTLLSYTFSPETGVSAWAVHSTVGKILDVAVVSGDDRDHTFFLVYRGGMIHLERLFPQDFDGPSVVDGRYLPHLDSARFFEDDENLPSIERIHFLPHEQIKVFMGDQFQNMKVRAVGMDGEYISDAETVEADGSVTFTFRHPREKLANGLWVGLPYGGELHLLDLPMEKLRVRNVKRVAWEVNQARGLWTGPDHTRMVEWRQRTMMDGYRAPKPSTELAVVYVESTWDLRGAAILQQRLPLPVTVVGVTREGELGD